VEVDGRNRNEKEPHDFVDVGSRWRILVCVRTVL